MSKIALKILLSIFLLISFEARAQFFLNDPEFEKQIPQPHKKFTHCLVSKVRTDYDYNYECYSEDLLCYVAVFITDKPEFILQGCTFLKWSEERTKKYNQQTQKNKKSYEKFLKKHPEEKRWQDPRVSSWLIEKDGKRTPAECYKEGEKGTIVVKCAPEMIRDIIGQ